MFTSFPRKKKILLRKKFNKIFCFLCFPFVWLSMTRVSVASLNHASEFHLGLAFPSRTPLAAVKFCCQSWLSLLPCSSSQDNPWAHVLAGEGGRRGSSPSLSWPWHPSLLSPLGEELSPDVGEAEDPSYWLDPLRGVHRLSKSSRLSLFKNSSLLLLISTLCQWSRNKPREKEKMGSFRPMEGEGRQDRNE